MCLTFEAPTSNSMNDAQYIKGILHETGSDMRCPIIFFYLHCEFKTSHSVSMLRSICSSCHFILLPHNTSVRSSCRLQAGPYIFYESQPPPLLSLIPKVSMPAFSPTLRPCLDHLKISSFFTLSPSHQFLDACMEH